MSDFPKLNSEYYEEITNQIKSGINRISDLTKEKNQLDKMIKSGNYAGDKLRKMTEERNSTGIKLSRIREEEMRTVKNMCDEFAEELRREDDLNPKDIVPEDLELLKHMSILTDRDLKAMIDRNHNNRTMTQIILRHCREHGNRDLQLGIIYEGNNSLIQNVNMIPDLCKTFFRYSDGMEGNAGYVYNQVMGEGTNLATMFSPEND